MYFKQLFLALLLVVGGAATASATASRSLAGHGALGTFWAIYNATADPADDSCLVTEGESVEEACCENAGDLLPHAALQGNDTCFSLGPGIVPFSGCVGDGAYGYGENCVGEGAPFVAADAEECGCSFVIEGSGCYKANDIPGQQWFVFLDADACKVETMSDVPTASPVSGACTTATVYLLAFGFIFGLVLY